ncbi:MAG: type II secretion system protein [Planctomycetota bacterium]|nr:MAG: type II secretion system protein [Planctomycetota bacterium]
MKSKALTLVDLLVVIAVITLLLGLMLPAGAAVRQRAYRMVCRTNLSGIGKAMLAYSDDNEEQYPQAGWPDSPWSDTGELRNWYDQRGRHYGKAGSPVTITSSFYLLIKYADMTPQQFVCRGDLGTRVFSLSDVQPGILPPDVNDITQVWDFGQKQDMITNFVAGQYCSYSYHMPYYQTRDEPGFPVTPASNPASPLCGDRSPYLDKNAWPYLEGKCCNGDPDEDCPTWHADGYYYDPHKTGNSACHRREGQNILFNDGHVLFAEYPNVGLNNDNVWKNWTTTDAPESPAEWQVNPTPYCAQLNEPGQEAPMGKSDAFLVNELNKEAW